MEANKKKTLKELAIIGPERVVGSVSGRIDTWWGDLKKSIVVPHKKTAERKVVKKYVQVFGVGLSRVNPALEAFIQGKLGFGFSGGGFMFFYFVGVVKELIRQKIITKETHLAGSSAGSLIAVSLKCGLSIDETLDFCLDFASDCRARGTKGRLSDALRKQLEIILPEDAHIICSGSVHIGVTFVWPVLNFQDVSYFYSKEDLIEALLASCYIPSYSGNSFTTTFRGKTVMDGCVTNIVPSPMPAKYTVKVCCMPVDMIKRMLIFNEDKTLHQVDICPGVTECWPYNYEETMQRVTMPGEKSFLLELIEMGGRDAAAWASSSGITQYVQFKNQQ